VNQKQPFDVVIVGAGIIGLAHAVEAVRRDLSVMIIDRDDQAVGASVRNFGHCCITAQSADLLDLAYASRAGWLWTAERAGLWVKQSGALVAAVDDAELELIKQLAADRGVDHVRPLSAGQVRERLGGGSNAIIGGALLPDDLRVDPRSAAAGIAAWLAGQPQVRFGWRTSALGFEPGVVHTTRGDLVADQVLVCVGHDVDYLLPTIADDHEIRRCSLNMARIRLADRRPIEPAVLTGTSLLRYDAFAQLPAAGDLRSRIAGRAPHLLDIDANLMATQLCDGTMIIGDSHETRSTVEPFLSEQVTRTLLDATDELLDLGDYTVIERWQGIYAKSPAEPIMSTEVCARVTAVSVTTGIGMTLSFGLAARTFG
jgi:FAD dependent oxidoreductase TIGR03364